MHFTVVQVLLWSWQAIVPPSPSWCGEAAGHHEGAKKLILWPSLKLQLCNRYWICLDHRCQLLRLGVTLDLMDFLSAGRISTPRIQTTWPDFLPISRLKQTCEQVYIPHICHERHGRRPCKFYLAGVNFYRFNAKNWHFRQIFTRKSGVFLQI